MINLYLKILETLQGEEAKKEFESNKLTPIKYIDLYRGQPIRPGRFEYFDLPAVFVGYNINWRTHEVNLDIHVMLDQNHSTANISINKLKGLEIMKYYQVIRELLVDLESEETSKLQLSNEQSIEADVVNYQVITFSCKIEKVIKQKYVESKIESIDIKEGEIRRFLAG